MKNDPESTEVPISLLLTSRFRTKDGIARVEQIASQLGMKVASTGNVSVCCQLSLSTFQKLFGMKPIEIPSNPPGCGDFGTPTGFCMACDLPVPTALDGLVELISVEPPSTRMTDPPVV